MIDLAAKKSATSSVETGQPTIRSALAKGAAILRAAGIDTAWLDAEILLGESLRTERAQLYLERDSQLSSEALERYLRLLRRRSRHEPIAYMRGRKEFWSLEFWVTPDVLIPRPETERLVEVALECARQLPGKRPLRILDVGTGSGVIAVCLAEELREAEVWAVELSARALAVAMGNAQRHGLAEKIRFLQGNMFEAFAVRSLSFDLIVSNPPYVQTGELKELMPDVRDWEPVMALDGGVDGMDYYRHIAAYAGDYLAQGGWLVVEIGGDLAPEVARIFAAVGRYAPVSVFQDYAGKDRVVAARKLLTESDRKGSTGG